MNIKIKLTLKLLLSMLFVVWITFIVYVVLNIITFNFKLSLSDDFFNLSFDSKSFVQVYVDDLERDEEFNIDDQNEKILLENNIWIQLLDTANKEVYSVNKPENVPSEYTAYELIQFIESPWESPAPTTAVIGNVKNGSYTLIVGYPINKIHFISFWYSNDVLKYHGLIIIFCNNVNDFYNLFIY